MRGTTYTDLDTDHKRTFLVNQQALLVAVEALSKITGTPVGAWKDEIWKQCYAKVAALTDVEVEIVMQTIEQNYQEFDQLGIAVIVEVEKT